MEHNCGWREAGHAVSPFLHLLQFDSNGDGEVTLGELQQAMQRLLGEKLSPQELAEVVQEADINGDGTVNFEGESTLFFFNFILQG